MGNKTQTCEKYCGWTTDFENTGLENADLENTDLHVGKKTPRRVKNNRERIMGTLIQVSIPSINITHNDRHKGETGWANKNISIDNVPLTRRDPKARKRKGAVVVIVEV